MQIYEVTTVIRKTSPYSHEVITTVRSARGEDVSVSTPLPIDDARSTLERYMTIHTARVLEFVRSKFPANDDTKGITPNE